MPFILNDKASWGHGTVITALRSSVTAMLQHSQLQLKQPCVTITNCDRLVLRLPFLFYRSAETRLAVPSVTYTTEHVNVQVTATNIRQPG